jgi:hypothetical protein
MITGSHVKSAQAAHARRLRITAKWLRGKPCEAIGAEMGITKQRVHQIVVMTLERCGCSRARRGERHLIPHINETMRAWIDNLSRESATPGD